MFFFLLLVYRFINENTPKDSMDCTHLIMGEACSILSQNVNRYPLMNPTSVSTCCSQRLTMISIRRGYHFILSWKGRQKMFLLRKRERDFYWWFVFKCLNNQFLSTYKGLQIYREQPVLFEEKKRFLEDGKFTFGFCQDASSSED